MNSDMAMRTSQHLCEANGSDHISITIVTSCTGKYHQSIAVCIVTSVYVSMYVCMYVCMYGYLIIF